MSVAEKQMIDVMGLPAFPGSAPGDQLPDVSVVTQPITVPVGDQVGSHLLPDVSVITQLWQSASLSIFSQFYL